MLQITYISSAIPGLPAQAFDDLLLQARRRNYAAGVTGLLVYDGRRFLQALEGERAEVEATFERIRLDSRHRALVLLSSREVSDREFGPWEMASQLARPATSSPNLAEAVDALTECVSDRNARALFRGFARIDRKAA